MFLSKKSVVKSLLIIGLLGMPQKAKADPFSIIFITGMSVIAVTSVVTTYITRKCAASNLVQKQSDISLYQADVWIDKNKDKKVNFTAYNPDIIFHDVMNYAKTFSDQKCKIQITPSITLNKGETIVLKPIKVRSEKIDKLRNSLTDRFFVYDEFHLTYKPKILFDTLWISAWTSSIFLL